MSSVCQAEDNGRAKTEMLDDEQQFGQPSTVWMYRQATQMRSTEVSFVTHHHVDRVNYPGSEIAVHEYPYATLKPTVIPRVVRQQSRVLGGSRHSFLPNPREEQWLHKLITQTTPAVVLAQYGRNAIRYADFFQEREIPLLVQFNGFDLSRAINDPSYVRALRRAIQKTRGFVVVAEYMREWLLENGAPEDSIRKIPYGAPLKALEASSCVGDPNCRFLAVGNFVEKKRPDLTIRAFAKCFENVPSASLRIVGGGIMLEQCKALAKQLRIDHVVDFLGTQPNDVVKKEMSQASVFVQHSATDSQGDKEGWPVAVGEAAASGLPIVSTFHASIPEQVDNNKTGFLVAEKDWAQMAENMALLAQDPSLRRQMGTAAREKMRDCTTADQIEKLEEFLHACANRVVG